MKTPTARLGLLRPEDLDQVDISQLNANMDILDTAGGIAIVASSQPATPYTGQLWYDTVAARLKVWTGSGWAASMPPLPYFLSAKGSSPINLNTTPTAIPGATVTLNHPRTNMKYMAIGIWDFDITVIGTGVCTGRFRIDGVANSNIQALFSAPSTSSRATISAVSIGTIATTGNHSYALEAYLNVASGDANATANSNITVQVFDS